MGLEGAGVAAINNEHACGYNGVINGDRECRWEKCMKVLAQMGNRPQRVFAKVSVGALCSGEGKSEDEGSNPYPETHSREWLRPFHQVFDTPEESGAPR